MADINPAPKQENWLEEPAKLPGTLNVVSILTFIGCGIFFCLSLWGFLGAQGLYDSAVANQEKMANAPAWARSLQGPDPIGTARASLDNKVPIFLLAVVGYFLCLYGAIMMRRLKKTGFTLYCVGEVLPLLSAWLFVPATLAGFRIFISLFFIALFIILYASQLKYMKK